MRKRTRMFPRSLGVKGDSLMITRTMWMMGTSELRACALCKHAVNNPEGGRSCLHSDVTGGKQRPAMPCNIARAPGGACGPEAEHLDFPGWSAMRISR